MSTTDLRTPRKRALAAATLAAAMAVLAAPAWADEGMTLQGSVDPMDDAGKPVGCQASFGVARRDLEYGAGGASLAVGALAVMTVDGQPRVALKLGLLDAEATDKVMSKGGEMQAVAPVSVSLLEDGGDPHVNNSAESLGSGTAEQGFGVYRFAAGPVTRRVLAQAARNGRFKVSYVLRDGGPTVRFAVDVTVSKRDMMHSDNTVIDPKAATALAACVAQVLKP